MHIEPLLHGVQKPARYTGGELGVIQKDKTDKLRFAFCFPDVYEVGMSHLGMKILYHILNLREDVFCERVFSPWADMEQAMESAGMPLFSLETRSPLAEFDILGFTLQYELSYSNVLHALRLGGLPLRSADRREEHPLVVAGGPCAFNPEPLADFIDLFLIGDGEESTPQLVDLYQQMRGAPREELLLAAANTIQGAYVPGFYQPQYDADGRFLRLARLRDDVPERILRAAVRDLNAAPYPDQIIVPNTEIVHDRVMLEIARGCTRGCRFCQAGMIYRPSRERSVDRLLALAGSLLGSSGYEEISLSSLSAGDYTCLNALAAGLMQNHAKDRVAVSLPSLRIDSELSEALGELSQVRRSSLTFAPEAGTQRLRDVINKGVTAKQMIDQAREAFEMGYSSVKLYFMIGLPTETDDDLYGIADLVRQVAGEFYALPKDRRSPKGLRISASASSFVPKPFTPFQWCGQDSQQELQRKQRLLKDAFRGLRSAQISGHDIDVSLLEAAFARGDRRTGAALERAAELGCAFDGWSERFRMDLWRQAFFEQGLSIEELAEQIFDVDAPLPWQHIDCGVSMDYLKGEYQRAMAGQFTPDCRNGCLHCGVANLYPEGCPCA